MKPTTLHLTDELATAIEEGCKETKMGKQEFIRQSLARGILILKAQLNAPVAAPAEIPAVAA